jgi:dolichol-phosphate mannosyltransferase
LLESLRQFEDVQADSEESASTGLRVQPNVAPPSVAAVIPCFQGRDTVVEVIRAIGPEVDRIYVVDDGCPDASGDYVARMCGDPRIVVLHNGRNLGVGGAMKHGYRRALADGAEILVKLDADGQMDPALITHLLAPIRAGTADYAKGNRFARPHLMPAGRPASAQMPFVRRVGNNILSFVHKAVTGYWNIYDPTNGYTAVHRDALAAIDLDAIADCYFFETDLLFQLNLAGAVVRDVPLPAVYSGEVSNLRVRVVLRRFPFLVASRFWKRIGIKYFAQDFNVASLEILLGLPLLLAGIVFGLWRWMAALDSGVANSAGTVMFAALPIIMGFQLLLAAVSYDVVHVPRDPISRRPGRP